jgi:pantoate--beta-alanine ligase
MDVFTDLATWRTHRATWDAASVGFVPTMGYLHAGHLSLVRAARQNNVRVVASIFVNPLQFGPSEDLAAYPRDLPRDLAMLEGAGVDAVLAPSPEAMYPPGFSTRVTLAGPIVERLDGARRPGHFNGVATVVTKFLLLTQPTCAYFGQKDAQQVAVVRRFVADLSLPVEIVVCSIVRDTDGLALSSRNVYLTTEERKAALVVPRALAAGRALADAGIADPEAVCEAMRATIATESLAALDYADVADPGTLVPLDAMRPPALLAVSARVGKPHLIDNYLWRADGTWDVGIPSS